MTRKMLDRKVDNFKDACKFKVGISKDKFADSNMSLIKISIKSKGLINFKSLQFGSDNNPILKIEPTKLSIKELGDNPWHIGSPKRYKQPGIIETTLKIPDGDNKMPCRKL